MSIFFFSSRRRHTRCYRDWSSDVCSSDLSPRPSKSPTPNASARGELVLRAVDPERSEERGEGKRGDLGGRRIIKKKKKKKKSKEVKERVTRSIGWRHRDDSDRE